MVSQSFYNFVKTTLISLWVLLCTNSRILQIHLNLRLNAITLNKSAPYNVIVLLVVVVMWCMWTTKNWAYACPKHYLIAVTKTSNVFIKDIIQPSSFYGTLQPSCFLKVTSRPPSFFHHYVLFIDTVWAKVRGDFNAPIAVRLIKFKSESDSDQSRRC